MLGRPPCLNHGSFLLGDIRIYLTVGRLVGSKVASQNPQWRSKFGRQDSRASTSRIRPAASGPSGLDAVVLLTRNGRWLTT